MSRRDKIGLAVLILLFVVFIVALVFTFKSPGPEVGFENNFIVQQRIRNLNR
ncbi:MAG: hypothetical protein AMXMBFR4_17360 [Candidatus Hydrogenedentota bacterium]